MKNSIKKIGNWSLLGGMLLASAVMFSGLTTALAAGNMASDTVKATGSAKLVPIVNPKCPVMNTVLMDKEVEENMTRMYKNQRVGFCCNVCLKKWDAMNGIDRGVVFKQAMGENLVDIVNPKCPTMGSAMETTAPERMTRMYKAQRIGFCCEGCLKKWDAMSAAEREPFVRKAMGENLVDIANPKCPVMDMAMEKKAEEKMTRMYRGQRIGFCCEVCLKKWDAMSAAEREPFVRKSMGENLVEIANPTCPTMGSAMETTAPKKMTRMYKGRRIGFCCEMCLKKWDAMSNAEKEPLVREAMQPRKK
jgi:hypothetical protein